jgi:hypothetical protein
MRRQLIWALVLALASFGIAHAQGVQTGELNGVVKSSDGQPLPGATVSITSPALLGTRTTVSDSQGGYILRGLPTGVYTITFELPGMTKVQQKKEVGLGTTAEVNATLSVATVQETVTVTAEAPTPLTTSEGTTNLRSQVIDNLPTGRSPALAATLAPGATDNTPNGNQITVSGAFAYDNVFLIDGVDVDDNLFGSPQDLFIEDAIQETQVLTSGISAEYGRFSGGVVNVVTKNGGNLYSGSFRTDFENTGWTAKTPFEIKNNVTNPSTGTEIYQATFGGPIVKDKLWFFTAGRLLPASSQAQTFPDTGIATTTGTANKRIEAKLTGAITPNHTVTLAYTNNATTITNSPPFGFASTSLRDIDPRTNQTGSEPNNQFVATYNGVLTNKLFIEAQFSERHFEFSGLGGSGTDIVNDSPFFTVGATASPLGLYNATYFDASDPEQRNNRQMTAALSYFLSTSNLGRHDLKLGWENFRSQRTGGNSQSPTNYVFYDDYVIGAGGGPLIQDGRIQPSFVPGVSARGIYLPERGAVLNVTTNSFFLNDKWQVNSHLSMNLGGRAEFVRSEATGGIVGVNTNTIVPRLAASYDPQGNGKFKLDATYAWYAGKYNEAQIGANNNVGNPNFLYQVYTGPAGQGLSFAPGFNSTNYQTVFGSFPTANVSFNPNLSSPVSKEFTFAAGTELGKGGYVKAIYTHRKITNFIGESITFDLGKTTLICPSTAPCAGQNLGTFDNIKFANTNVPTRAYDAVQLQTSYRFTDKWDATLYYTRQINNDGNYEGEARNQPALTGLIGQYPEIYTPSRDFPEGNLAPYEQDRVRAWTNYNLGLGGAGNVILGVLFRYDSGLTYSLIANNVPFSAEQVANNPGYAHLPAFQNLYFGSRGSQFYNGAALFDLSLTYSIPIFKSLKPYFKFELFNAFNNEALESFNTTITADPNSPLDQFGLPTGYIKGSKFGQATGNSNYPTAAISKVDGTALHGRTYDFALGFRF